MDYLRPIMNWEPVIVAIIVAIPSTIGVVRGWRNPTKLDSIHLDINSRIDQLVRASKAESKAEGMAQERVEERERQGNGH